MLLEEALREELSGLRERALYRDLKRVDSPAGAHIRVQGRTLVNFASNDYLGLAGDASVTRAAAAAAKKWGAGSGASRLISGDLAVHEQLENALAAFKGEEAALVYSSGYLANLGAVTALLNEKDVILFDRLNHASLIDAARLSKAKLWVYPHRDANALEELLAKAGPFRRRLITTDAYFSMDGTVAPLDRIAELANKHDAWLMVDEAHSTGVFGENGRGLSEHFGLNGRIDVVMGTLSKAIGSSGGFIAGSRALKDFLVNRSREFIYTTAPVPASSGAAIRALELIGSEPARRKRLWRRCRELRAELASLGFDLMGSEGPIIPVLIGDSRAALDAQAMLFKEGLFVPAVRPPTVQAGSDRLRLSVTAAHSDSDIERLFRGMRKIRGARR